MRRDQLKDHVDESLALGRRQQRGDPDVNGTASQDRNLVEGKGRGFELDSEVLGIFFGQPPCWAEEWRIGHSTVLHNH
ncbi:hypothetical protein PQR68_07760 [Paraburkholderia agricolaris]|uniref:hypothetical protein n=1 Tax=Paraburkholderia agricolaris TaxID=2152888 RepID=UPI0038BDD99E